MGYTGIVLVIVTTSLLAGCGSAEPVEFFTYTNSSMPKLETAVNAVFKNNSNPNLIWDTATNLIVNRYRDENNDKNGSIKAKDQIKTPKGLSAYNWLTIKENETVYNYEFSLFMLPSTKVAIVINSLWNNQGLDLRQGENVGEFNSSKGKAAKKIFEKTFIDRIDTEMNQKHSIGRSFWDQ